MKKLKMLLCSVLAAAVFAGCAGGQNGTAQSEGTQRETEEPVSVPENMASMLEPADALMMCMLENNLEYSPSDSLFFWKALYYFAGIYAPAHDLAEVGEDGSMTLPRQTVQEFATALFADYDDLLPIPEEMSESVIYDSGWDAYTFYTGDRGLSEAEISTFVDNGDGTFTITAMLKDAVDGGLIREGEFVLEENPYVSGISRPIYYYSIKSAEIK